MSFTEDVITRTKQLEMLLKERGANGKGLHELVTSIAGRIGPELERKLRYIASVRNKLMHEHGYVFDGREHEFIATCDAAITSLSELPHVLVSTSNYASDYGMAPARTKPERTSPVRNVLPAPARPATRPIRVPPQRLGWDMWLKIVVLLLVALGALKYHYDASHPTTRAASATAPSPHFMTVAEAQREAMRRYPELGVAGSAFNQRFIELHREYQQTRPTLFLQTDWPLTVAHEVQTQLER